MTISESSSGAAPSSAATTFTFPAYTSNTSNSPSSGTTTCVCRASPKPSSGSRPHAPNPFRSGADIGHRVRSTPPDLSTRPRRAIMQNSSAFQFLALDTIHESTANPRRTFEESKLHELAESIRQHGLIQPITVRPNSEGFEIVAGARRVTEARSVPAIYPQRPLRPEDHTTFSDHPGLSLNHEIDSGRDGTRDGSIELITFSQKSV